MATNDCSPIKFLCITKTGFYFEDATKDMEEDSLRLSEGLLDQHMIRSNDNKFVILNGAKFQAQALPMEKQHKPDCTFNIQFYRDSSQGSRKGKPLMLYVIKEGKKMVVSCNDKREIHPVEMDLPLQIEDQAHRAVFYLTDVTTSKFTFESSWYPSEFLGFELDPENHKLSKLVLLKKEDEVDEGPEINFC